MVHAVYVKAWRPCGAIPIGRRTQRAARVEAHRAGLSEHRAKHAIRTPVRFWMHKDFRASLQRGRAIKRWPRAWKNALIAGRNPNWQDVTAQVPI
jgi:putative endonuclease